MSELYKKLLIAVGCIFFCVIIIVSLYAISIRSRSRNNGFERLFFPHPTSDIIQLNIYSDSFYISGTTFQNIFLSNYSNPKELLVIDHDLKKMHRVTLHFPDSAKVVKQLATVSIDSPNIYIMEGLSPYILQGSLSTFDLKNNIQDTFYFNKGVPISQNSYVLRIFSQKIKSNILAKLNSSFSLNNVQYKLNKQFDGILCTEGMLHYNKKLGFIVYVYSFQNKFVCLDTNLNLLYAGRTIDTNTQAKIKVANLSAKVQTFAAPPLYINKQSCIDSKRIFIYSAIRANNEDVYWFDKNSTIDVYSLRDGRYLYSFSIADFNKKKISSFVANSNRLFVLQGHYLSSFQIHF